MDHSIETHTGSLSPCHWDLDFGTNSAAGEHSNTYQQLSGTTKENEVSKLNISRVE